MFCIEPTVIRINLKEYLYNKYFCSYIFVYLFVIAGQKAGLNLPIFYLGHPGGDILTFSFRSNFKTWAMRVLQLVFAENFCFMQKFKKITLNYKLQTNSDF